VSGRPSAFSVLLEARFTSAHPAGLRPTIQVSAHWLPRQLTSFLDNNHDPLVSLGIAAAWRPRRFNTTCTYLTRDARAGGKGRKIDAQGDQCIK
jgi:hypothetical protein